MSDLIYFDHSATTYVLPEVAEAMSEFFTKEFGNPSSLYQAGQKVRTQIEEARRLIAELLGAESPSEIIFTSGGTESDNLAIKGVAFAKAEKGRHIITSAVEHPAVFETCKFLEKVGFKVSYIPVNKDGLVNPEDVAKAITKETTLITIMLANNVVGAVQPIKEISQIAKEHAVYLHTDAVQAIGNIPVNVKDLGVDFLSLSGHKFHAPKGIGLLYARKGARFWPLNHGGGQERGKRSGTENVPGIIGLAKALEIAVKEQPEKADKLTRLREKLVAGVLKSVPDVIYLGHPTKRLPNNACFSFKYIEGESLVLHLDMYGIAASSGSACASHSLEPSHVLLAMGLSPVDAHGSLRISMGRANTEAEVDKFLEVLPPVVEKLRAMSPFNQQQTPEAFMATEGWQHERHSH